MHPSAQWCHHNPVDSQLSSDSSPPGGDWGAGRGAPAPAGSTRSGCKPSFRFQVVFFVCSRPQSHHTRARGRPLPGKHKQRCPDVPAGAGGRWQWLRDGRRGRHRRARGKDATHGVMDHHQLQLRQAPEIIIPALCSDTTSCDGPFFGRLPACLPDCAPRFGLVDLGSFLHTLTRFAPGQHSLARCSMSRRLLTP